jgi:hypothetical protein
MWSDQKIVEGNLKEQFDQRCSPARTMTKARRQTFFSLAIPIV